MNINIKTNLLKQIEKKEKIQSYIYSLLFDRDNDINQKKLKLRNRFEKNKSKKEFSDKISKKCVSILSKIYNKMDIINNKMMKMKQYDSISLQNISKKYYRINTSKPYTSLNINKNKNLMTINSTQSTYYNSSNNFNKHIFNKTITNQKRTFNNFIRTKNPKSAKEIRVIESYKKSNIKKNKKIFSSIFKKKNEDKIKTFTEFDLNKLNKNNVNLENINHVFRTKMKNIYYKFNPKEHLKQLNEIQRNNIIFLLGNIWKKLNFL